MRLATGDVKLRGLHRPWQPRRWQRPVGVAPREQHGHRFDERRLERRHRTGRSSLRMASLHTYPCEQVRRNGAGRGQLQLRRWRWRGPSRSGGASGAHQQGRVWHRAAFREAGRLRSTGAAAARAVGGELQRVRIPLRQGWAAAGDVDEMSTVLDPTSDQVDGLSALLNDATAEPPRVIKLLQSMFDRLVRLAGVSTPRAVNSVSSDLWL